ncbi:uncharacterized protein LOC132166876 isoform X4 [Corylus avellana]|uniref:uncharacterized protein LOC132166876 isoform X4 n=1 Tax=Corylus avellana TaxID=13451 RepID=UPI00286B222B|nr:uncharacterized protein LOC132166876 isoform X4 [Corylus avellana]
MAENVRFESCSASPEEYAFMGSYTNVQRGSYTGVSLDRSGSFREDGETRVFGSTMSSRGSAMSTADLPPLSECLMLDPITMGDQKYTRSGELRRVFGISYGSTVEDNIFGAAHSKSLPPVAIEELKRFKATVRDASIKASHSLLKIQQFLVRGRAKKFDDYIHKLNKYCEALNSKKQQRSDMLTNERSGGSNFLKTGTQIQRYLLAQGTEDKPKSVVLNKRVRSSVAETKAEGRKNSSVRQPLFMGKDRGIMLKDVGEGSDTIEEKIRRLPVGGEMWDRKMKRKRSVGTASMRPIDGDVEPKRVMHHKYKNEPAQQSSDVQRFRSGSFNGSSGISKDGTSLPVGSNARVIPKNEFDRVSLSRDLTSPLSKERKIAKGNNKLTTCEGDSIVSPNPLTKGKAPRAPRSSPVMAGSSSPNLPCTSGEHEVCEQPPSIKKFHSASGANNRKCPVPSGSPSHPMAQWGGQRTQKNSRTRRTNLVSPVSGRDEPQTSSEACLPSDLGARVTSVGTNGLLLARNGIKHFRVKHEKVSSPARLSESEESGAGENLESRSKDKGSGSFEVDKRAVNSVQNVVPSVLFTEKIKVLNKGETRDGKRKQGRTGRGSSVSRASISPMREKLETPASTKPPRCTKPASEKNGSKSRRPPLKKLSDRKAFTHLGHTSIGGSPDLAGESDDDHEELLAAANFACNASYLACSSSFWKKMEPIFASVSLADASYLKQQGEPVPGKNCSSQAPDSGEKERVLEEQIVSNGMTKTGDLDDHDQDIGNFEKIDLERTKNVTPFYQRVLAALIVEDEAEEFEENNGERDMSFQYNRDHSPNDTCLPVNVDDTNRVRTESNSESILGLQTQKQCAVNRFSCSGRTNLTRGTGIHSKLSNNDLFQGDHGFMHSNNGMFPSFSGYLVEGPLAEHTNASGISSIGCPYDQMSLEDKLFLELQSIGLYPETVPDLADGEDDLINQDVELQKELYQQVGKRNEHMNKISKAIEEGRKMEERDLEQVAMGRLLELAYKKQLATRGSTASKLGVSRVSKPVALAFTKRTLSKCRKFEDTGKSCFTEPSLRDVILASPSHGPFPSISEQHDLHSDKTGSSSFDDFGNLTYQSDQDFAKTGPIYNRGKKKEVLLDDVGGIASSRAVSTLGNTQVGGAKGKRSEREKDKDAGRNSVAKASRTLPGNIKGERKAKTKPKQKTAQLLTSGNGFGNKFTETIHSEYHSPRGSSEVVGDGSNAKGGIALMSHGDIPQDPSTEIKEPLDITNFHELDSIELGVTNDFSGPQDLSTWLNIDDDNLQDLDFEGLDIPLDDISELNMQF